MNYFICLLLIHFLTAANANLIKTKNSTSCHRLCVCQDFKLDCSSQNLTTVPNDLPSTAKIILLNNNEIRSLSANFFSKFPNLTLLDLSNNKLNCNCSLNWTKNVDSKIRLSARCETPSWLKGRSLSNISSSDLCVIDRNIHETTARANVVVSLTSHSVESSLMTSHEFRFSSVKTQATSLIHQTSDVIVDRTVFKSLSPSAIGVAPSKSLVSDQIPNNFLSKLEIVITSKTVSPSSSTIKPNIKDEMNRNLEKTVERSSSLSIDSKLLMDLVEQLERHVDEKNESDDMTTEQVLRVASNIMKDENLETWNELNKNFSAGERILKVINKAMKLQAFKMLQSVANGLQSFIFNESNIYAEIQVFKASKVSSKDFNFLSTLSLGDGYFELPKSKLANLGEDSIAIVGIRSSVVGELLPRRSLIADFSSFEVDSDLISASILNSNVEEVQTPLKLIFRRKKFLGKAKAKELAKCVFWKNRSGVSGWSDDGCTVVSRNKSMTLCDCNHMTDFAVITQSIAVVPEPTIVMYIAVICLLVGVTLAFIRNVIYWHQTRRERLTVLIHECAAIILTSVVFFLGLCIDYHKVTCTILAALLHWFVLAVFCWILVEFLQLNLCVHCGWNRRQSRLKYFAFLGWGLPFVLVLIMLAITQDREYGSKMWCWYSDSKVILFTFACPIALCIMLCIILILKIECHKFKGTDISEKKNLSVITALSGLLILFVVCTFVTAALSADRPAETIFQYLFTVSAIILAVYIFVYHFWLDREISKLSVLKNAEKSRPKRDYYSTKETVMYSEGTSEGKSFSLIFPSRKSPKKKHKKSDKKSPKRSESSSEFDYDATLPMYPTINDASLKSFKSQVSTHQHTLDKPPNTASAIKISRHNSESIELTSPTDLDRRPDGAEQTDTGDFYGSKDSNPPEDERQRTSGCSADCSTNATTFGKDKVDEGISTNSRDSCIDGKNRTSAASSTQLSRTSRSSVSGASLPIPSEDMYDEEVLDDQPFIRRDTSTGPEIRSDPPSKIPKRRTRCSRRRLDDELNDNDGKDGRVKKKRASSSLPSTDENSVELKHFSIILSD